MIKKIIYIFCVFILTCAYGQTKNEIQKIKDQYDLNILQSIEKRLEIESTKDKAEALRIAQLKGWKTEITNPDGSFMQLQKVVDGKPVYYTTFNVSAARSTRTNHLNNGGSLGLSLNGQGMTAYVWDGGGTRITHREFDGAGGNNRVSIIDGSTLNRNSFHAQHVTGTIVASGVNSRAKGMAPHARAKTADWEYDVSEAAREVRNGMLVSNHSYGIAAINRSTGNAKVAQYYFGGYVNKSRQWDEILFNAPNYLMVVAAGNDGNFNNANRTPTGGFGWDKLTGHATSKNNLVVANAHDANIDSNGNLISVSINNSSSEGPTDDMRIKPDITGNGTGVYSTYDNNDSAYNSITGTSMASPNVSGSLLLLQQHYINLRGNFMRAATLKGLALHTADDAGVSGPDAVFGWGLLNTKKAAETITSMGDQSRVEELMLKSGETYTITVNSDGINPLLASISWTDRPGRATTTVNSTTPVLINDLDIRVSKTGTTYFPYELTTPTTSAKRDNNVDPFERVDVRKASGTYTITVKHKGGLVGGSQNFSLIITGISKCVDNLVVSNDVNSGEIDNKEASNILTAKNKIKNGAIANYDAGQKVYLKPGFRVDRGGKFRGFIEGCSGIVNKKINKTRDFDKNQYVSSEIIQKSINETNSLKDGVSVYPNPFDNVIYVKTKEPVKSWKLVNINGQIMESKTGELNKINTSNLSPGIYFIEMTINNNEIVREKIIKKGF